MFVFKCVQMFLSCHRFAVLAHPAWGGVRQTGDARANDDVQGDGGWRETTSGRSAPR